MQQRREERVKETKLEKEPRIIPIKFEWSNLTDILYTHEVCTLGMTCSTLADVFRSAFWLGKLSRPVTGRRCEKTGEVTVEPNLYRLVYSYLCTLMPFMCACNINRHKDRRLYFMNSRAWKRTWVLLKNLELKTRRIHANQKLSRFSSSSSLKSWLIECFY